MDLKKDVKLFDEFPEVSTQLWEETIHADLKGADYDKKLIWKTDEGFNVRPYYRAEDLKNVEYLKQLSSASYFVRGQKTKDNDWAIVQEISETNPSAANKIAVDAIAKGAQVVCFNTSKVKTNADMAALIKGIKTNKVGVRFKHSSSYTALIELFITELKNSNADLTKVTGSIDFDPICYLLLHNKFYSSQRNDINELISVVKTIDSKLLNFKAITINAATLHNSGSTIVQEMGYALSWASDYLATASDKGLDVNKIANNIMFTLSVGSNYFMEIAKLRAFRMLWAIVAEQYKVDIKKLKIYIHSEGSSWNKTLYDPNVNMLRSTTEAMAATIGGTNSLYLQSYDLMFKNDDDFSRRISRNIQLVLKHESYFDKTIDPAAGSYYIENLTDNLAKEAWNIFQYTEANGGFIKLASEGIIKKEIEAVAAKRNLDIANRKTVILGTNQYPNQTEFMLDKIEDCNYCCQKHEGLKPYRGSFAFDELRLATEKYSKAKNHNPNVFMLTIGNLAMRKARASFSSNVFACAGYEIIDNLGFEAPDDGIKAAINAKADIVVICSSDEEYTEFAPQIAQELKKINNNIKVIVAGYPQEILDKLTQAGVDDFIHVRTNVLDFLTKYHKLLGIK